MFKLKGVLFLILVFIFIAFCCSAPKSKKETLSAEFPLHLEEHIAAAEIEGSDIPKYIPAAVEWRFDQEQPDWKIATYQKPIKIRPAKVTRVEDALRITLAKENKSPWGLKGGISIDLPNWGREKWGYFIVRARTAEKIELIEVEVNDDIVDYAEVINDGSVQTYLMRADWSGEEWKRLGIHIHSQEPASFDLLSISVVPKEINYSQLKVGVSTEARCESYRRTIFTHVPGKLEYRVKVPKDGRLDFGLGVVRADIPVTFKVTARADGSEAKTLLNESYLDKGCWAQRSVDLSSLAGKTVHLALETVADTPRTVAFWAAPTLVGSRVTHKPNIILYIIDGAAAEFMSVYGYNRRTTPNLERLAAEGAVFEHANSNSSWTKASVTSFMTSLHHSILGGYKNDSDPLPEQAVTMAQHVHRAGYQTAVFVSNSYCGRMSSLDRGVDVLRDTQPEKEATASNELNKDFWNWRETYPGEPYWVHFQATDVHAPWKLSAPFAGLYVSPELHKTFEEWFKKIWENQGTWEERFEKSGLDRTRYFNVARGLYDETMAHQDDQIGRLVERLKMAGEWDNTLFIVAADHSYSSAGLITPLPGPQKWETPCFSSNNSHIPLIFIWPERIAPGRRFNQRVSMIDVLPTILDLAGLPAPGIMQGQSLAPLLLGKKGWKPRPIVFDEFYVDADTGDLVGAIEVLDERWGASLLIDPRPDDKKKPKERLRPAPLLLFDVWDDPYCLKSLHKERADLVEKYAKFLEQLWKEHQSLAKKFTHAGQVPLSAEQLRTLRSLGYIR